MRTYIISWKQEKERRYFQACKNEKEKKKKTQGIKSCQMYKEQQP